MLYLALVSLWSNQMESFLKRGMYFQFQSIYCFVTNTVQKSMALKSHTFETVTVYFDFLDLLLIYASGLFFWPNVSSQRAGGSLPTCSHPPWALLNDQWSLKKSTKSTNPWNLMNSVLLHCDWYSVSRPGLLIDF